MRYTFLLFALFVIGQSGATAQSISKPQARQNLGIIYDRESALDLRIHTYGFAANLLKGRIKSYDKTTYYLLGLGLIRSPKEVRVSVNLNNIGNAPNVRSYRLGKQNTFLPVRIGMGFKKYYSEKATQKGVAVGINLEGGGTIGLLKPYYLTLRTFSADFLTAIYREERYTEANRSKFLDYNSIAGAAPILKGIGEMSVIPGIHGQAALHLDWGAFDQYIRALEVGIMLDVFPRAIPIMIQSENSPYFLNAYLSLQLGKRE